MNAQKNVERQCKALGNARRLAMLRLIKKDGRTTVSDLAHTFHITVPSVSKHLAILERAGILRFDCSGKFVVYRLLSDQQEPAKTVLRML